MSMEDRVGISLSRPLSREGEGRADNDNSIAKCKPAAPGFSLSGVILPFLPIVCFLFLFLLPCVSRGELIDRIVASINNEVITLSELNQAIQFNLLLGGGKGEHIRAETLEGLVNRRLLVQEAHRLKFVELSDQDVDKEIDKLKKRLGSDAAYSDFLFRLDAAEEQLRRMLGERLLVERFIEKKIGLFVRVTREEVEAFFNANAGRFKGSRLEEVQKEIRNGLQAQKLEQHLSAYLVELRTRADVRVQP